MLIGLERVQNLKGWCKVMIDTGHANDHYSTALTISQDDILKPGNPNISFHEQFLTLAGALDQVIMYQENFGREFKIVRRLMLQPVRTGGKPEPIDEELIKLAKIKLGLSRLDWQLFIVNE